MGRTPTGQTKRTRRTLAIGLVAVVLIVAACGADGEDGGDDRAETSSTLDETGPTSTDAGNGDEDTTTSQPDAATASTSTSASTSTPTSTVTSTSVPTSTSTAGRDGPELVDVRPVPIRSIRSLGSNDLELTVEGGVEPCFIIDRVEVVETGDQVELTVNAGSEPDAICIQIIELHTATVELDEALGDRSVVDGTTGQPLDVAS